MSNKVVVGYWNCRGLSHPIRLLLEHCQVDYEFRIIQSGPPPEFNKTEWMANKHKILQGFDFPNLPYYDDGDFKLTHTFAIMEHLGRKHGLVPADEKLLTDCDMMREEAVDMFFTIATYLYFPEHRSKGIVPSEAEKLVARLNFQKNVDKHLKAFEAKKTKSPGQFFIGDAPMYVDFILYEYLDHVRILEGEIMSRFPALRKFLDDFESLPKIRQYISSERYQRFPLWSERAFIGRENNDWPKVGAK